MLSRQFSAEKYEDTPENWVTVFSSAQKGASQLLICSFCSEWLKQLSYCDSPFNVIIITHGLHYKPVYQGQFLYWFDYQTPSCI